MSQLDLLREGERHARDAALDRLELTRQSLIEAADRIARDIADRRGQVTSSDVFREMRLTGYHLDGYDPRWMGAVFRKCKGWRRVGYTPDGSHCRPVAIWVRGS